MAVWTGCSEIWRIVSTGCMWGGGGVCVGVGVCLCVCERERKRFGDTLFYFTQLYILLYFVRIKIRQHL